MQWMLHYIAVTDLLKEEIALFESMWPVVQHSLP